MFNLFFEPLKIFALTSVIPARTSALRTAEPATNPREGAGEIMTVADDDFAFTS